MAQGAAPLKALSKRLSFLGTTPDEKRKDKHACIVFIAPTQHGKSTTIDKYYEAVSGRKPSESGVKDFVLGNGTTSASQETIMLPPIKVSYLSYVEWPDNDDASRELGRKKKDTYDQYYAAEDKTKLPEDLSAQLYDLRHEEMLGGSGQYHSNVMPGSHASVDTPQGNQDLMLTIVDTPGLDDSEGRGADDRIVEGILDALVDDNAPDLCAFIFVVKSGMSWSGSFLQSAKRYWDQFPTFRENWIFIHTSMDAYAEDFASGNCYEEACEIRKRELVAALTNAFDEEQAIVATLPHVFLENVGVMDSKRKAYRKKAEFQIMERAKGFNRLTKILCGNQMKKTTMLEYRKSNENETMDSTMLQLFEQRRQGVLSSLAPMQAVHGKAADKMVVMNDRVQVLEQGIRTAEERLAKIDCDEKIVKAKKTAHEEWTFWGGRAATYKLKVPFPKAAVSKSVTKNMGYPRGELFEEEFKFHSSKGETHLIVTCQSGWCRGYEFDIKLMVLSTEIYKEEIEELKSTKKVKEAELELVSKEYNELKAENSKMFADIEVFTKQTDFFMECVYQNNKKMVDLKVWKQISPFYKWAASAEGHEIIRNPVYSNVLVEKFCEVHGLLKRYREVVTNAM